jgi:hypothetical protein
VVLTQQTYSWKVTVDGSDGGPKLDLAFENQFNFQLFKPNDTAPFALSAYFNITNTTIDQYGNIVSTKPATLSAITLPRSTITTASTTISSTTATVLSSNASPTTKDTHTVPSSTSTNKAVVGAVVGIGCLVLMIIAALTLGFFLQRKAKAGGQYTSNDHAPKYSSREYSELQRHPQGDSKSVFELHEVPNPHVYASELSS